MCCLSRSEISPSRNPSSRSRPSTSVTSRPSAPKIVVYSHPITPAPTTALAVQEVVHGEVLADPVVDAVEPALVEAGKVERGLPQRLRRNRARVDAGPADLGSLLDDGDTLAEVRRLRRALFAGRPGPDHDQVVVGHAPRLSASRARRPR